MSEAAYAKRCRAEHRIARGRGSRTEMRVIGFTIFLCLAGCAGTPNGETDVTQLFREDVARLRKHTAPKSGAWREVMAPTGRSGTAEARWDVQASVPWKQYRAWVGHQVRAEFSVDSTSIHRISLSKGTSSDLYFAEITPDSLDSTLVHVSLRAVPR